MKNAKYQKKIADNIANRANYKAEIDSKINLSVNKLNGNLFSPGAILTKENTAIALSEGAVVDFASKEGIRFYLAKGAIQKAVDRFIEIDDEALVNVGHTQYSSNPYLGKIGIFNKEDLSINVKADGRSDLIIKLHLNDTHNVIKQLKKDNDVLSVSVEMQFDYDDYYYDEDLEMFIVKSFYLVGLGIVGNPANVNSYNQIKLSKGEDMKKTILTIKEYQEKKELGVLEAIQDAPIYLELEDGSLVPEAEYVETETSEGDNQDEDTKETPDTIQTEDTKSDEEVVPETEKENSTADNTSAEVKIPEVNSENAVLSQLTNLSARFEAVNQENVKLTVENVELRTQISELASYKAKYEQLEKHLANLAGDSQVASRQVDNIGTASKLDTELANRTRI